MNQVGLIWSEMHTLPLSSLMLVCLRSVFHRCVIKWVHSMVRNNSYLIMLLILRWQIIPSCVWISIWKCKLLMWLLSTVHCWPNTFLHAVKTLHFLQNKFKNVLVDYFCRQTKGCQRRWDGSSPSSPVIYIIKFVMLYLECKYFFPTVPIQHFCNCVSVQSGWMQWLLWLYPSSFFSLPVQMPWEK